MWHLAIRRWGSSESGSAPDIVWARGFVAAYEGGVAKRKAKFEVWKARARVEAKKAKVGCASSR